MEIGDAAPAGDRLTKQEIENYVRVHFPAKAKDCSLEFVGAAVVKTGMRFTLRLVVWDVDDKGSRSIRDVKEQECFFGDAPLRTDRARFNAYLEGWKRALEKAFASGMEVETLMPHDLSFAGTLGLVTVSTSEEFEAAHLVKSRLGRWMK